MMTPDQARQIQNTIAVLEGQAQRAEHAAPGVVSSAWAWLMGADSAASAAHELARHYREDATRFRARGERLMANPLATDGDVVAFLADAAAVSDPANLASFEANAALLSPVTAVREVGGGVVGTVAGAAPVVGVVLGVVAVAAVLLVLRDARRGARA